MFSSDRVLAGLLGQWHLSRYRWLEFHTCALMNAYACLFLSGGAGRGGDSAYCIGPFLRGASHFRFRTCASTHDCFIFLSGSPRGEHRHPSSIRPLYSSFHCVQVQGPHRRADGGLGFAERGARPPADAEGDFLFNSFERFVLCFCIFSGCVRGSPEAVCLEGGSPNFWTCACWRWLVSQFAQVRRLLTVNMYIREIITKMIFFGFWILISIVAQFMNSDFRHIFISMMIAIEFVESIKIKFTSSINWDDAYLNWSPNYYFVSMMRHISNSSQYMWRIAEWICISRLWCEMIWYSHLECHPDQMWFRIFTCVEYMRWKIWDVSSL